MVIFILDFYFGSNSATGFHTYCSELEEPKLGHRSYLIKGGAGTGKSTFMKKVIDKTTKKHGLVERIHCSSDPNSLDGVIIENLRVSMVDATPPHVIEPQYPGSYETVINLCEYFDQPKMEARLAEIVKLQRANGECHMRCVRLLSGANIFCEYNMNYAKKAIKIDNINDILSEIKAEHFTVKLTDNIGVEHKRLLSAVTNKGIISYNDTANCLCDDIYVIDDEYTIGANLMLTELRAIALAQGYTIYSCYNPIDHQYLEHLFIKELKLGFMTKTLFNKLDVIMPYKIIAQDDLYNKEILSEYKEKSNFYRKVIREFVAEAIDELHNAKLIHDKLEAQYTDCVNFDGVNRKVAQILGEIFA